MGRSGESFGTVPVYYGAQYRAVGKGRVLAGKWVKGYCVGSWGLKVWQFRSSRTMVPGLAGGELWRACGSHGKCWGNTSIGTIVKFHDYEDGMPHRNATYFYERYRCDVRVFWCVDLRAVNMLSRFIVFEMNRQNSGPSRKIAHQLSQITSTLTADELLAFTSEFHIPEGLHPEVQLMMPLLLLSRREDIVYHYNMHISQLHVLGSARILNFEINCRCLAIEPTVPLFRVFYMITWSNGWVTFAKRTGRYQCCSYVPDSFRHWNDRFFWVDDVVMPFEANWYTRENLVKDGRPGTDYPHHTPGDDMYPTFLQDDGPEMVPWTLANQDDHKHVRTDRRLRLDAEMCIPDLIRARTIRMVLRVDPKLAETPSVLNSELRNAASPRREVTGKENAGVGSSAFVPRLFEGEDKEEDLLLDRKRKRSVVGESVPPRKVCGCPGEEYLSLTLGAYQPLPETSLTLGTQVIQPVVHPSPDVLALEASVRHNIFWDSPSTSIMDFLDNITPPGRGVYLEQLSSADLLREMSVTTNQHATATAHLHSRFKRQSKQIEVFQQSTYKLVADKDSEITASKAQLAESVSAQAVLEDKVKTKIVRSQSLVEENASLSTQLQESQQRYNVRETKVSTQDNRLRRMNIEFDFELYPHFLSAIAERRWLIGSGLRLAVNNVLESPSVREAFAGAVRAAGAKGKSQGFIDGFNHCAANGELTALLGYDPEAIEKFSAAMGKLKNLDLSFISDVKGLKDHPITSVMSSLALPHSPGEGSSFESNLESQLSVAKVALKKSSKGGGPVWGVGAAHQPRPEGVLIGTSTLYPAHESFLARIAKGVQDTATPPSDRVKEAALKHGCLTLKISFLYLGSMVGGSMSRLHEWDEVVERVKTRLSKWKMKSLSIGGRLTLLKSVLRSMTIFHMSIFKVPVGVLRTLESIRSHFYNGHAWAAIYGEHGKIDADVKIGSRSCWLNIVHEAKALAHKDSWIEGDLLRNRFPWLKQRGGMEQEQFENLVTLMHDVSLSPMADRWSWTLENSGDFTVSSVRKRIDDKLIPKVGSKTRWVKYVPINVNVNAWKVKFDALPTRFNLSRRGIHIDSILCVIYDKEVETSWHLFFSCCMVRQMIRLITRWWDVPHEEFDDYDDWRNWIVNLRLPSKSKLMLEGVFYVMWWCLKSIQNKIIFEDKIPVKAVFFDDVATKSYNWCSTSFETADADSSSGTVDASSSSGTVNANSSFETADAA
nr:RNA-directed DNA polymerase, eukaryota [Tanacetum cinerariifolium]